MGDNYAQRVLQQLFPLRIVQLKYYDIQILK